MLCGYRLELLLRQTNRVGDRRTVCGQLQEVGSLSDPPDLRKPPNSASRDLTFIYIVGVPCTPTSAPSQGTHDF
jgi:hypothetical protein